MKAKAVKKLLFAASLAAVMAMSGSSALAQYSGNISYIENNATSQSSPDLLTSDPVITAILSQPGTVNGKTYSSWAFLANDGTGSIDVYGTMPTGSSYTPTVGDAITVTGEYYPYHQIPELENLSAISAVSSGNPVPGPLTETINGSGANSLNQTTLPYSIAGYLIQVNNVTISSGTGSGASTLTPGETWGTSNLQLTMTDATGSMTLYYWPTSYSVANANLYGQTIPTGSVDILGIDSVYTSGGNSTAEFIPIQVTSVPEPALLPLFGVGGLLTLTLALRRRSA